MGTIAPESGALIFSAASGNDSPTNNTRTMASTAVEVRLVPALFGERLLALDPSALLLDWWRRSAHRVGAHSLRPSQFAHADAVVARSVRMICHTNVGRYQNVKYAASFARAHRKVR
jgi:hypothetical protein